MASYQRRGDNSFLLVVEVGYDANGKRKKRTKTIRITDKALLKTNRKLENYLQKELAKFQIEVEAGEYIAPEKIYLVISYWNGMIVMLLRNSPPLSLKIT
ncbi:hypothetical protein Q7A53_18660 [Halobacillus rhizosphaerae]|uniref:hypothetical protein n=1 Tax=Halobacillus rhizosphaerae TaxID=3064889 RepID=UPI00398B439E